MESVRKMLPNTVPIADASIPNLKSFAFNWALMTSALQQSCCGHQKRIVDDILTLSKLDSKLVTLAPAPVRFDDMLQVVCEFENSIECRWSRRLLEDDFFDL